MLHKSLLLTVILSILICACSPAASDTGNFSTPVVITSSASTVEPVTSTSLPPGFTQFAPTNTSVPILSGGLGPSELKYRILDQYPDFFFCDPDYYPVARDDEQELALQRFPELQANNEEFNAILTRNNLVGVSKFTDEQKLLIYREHKKLSAIPFELAGETYQFQIQVAENEGEGELITGRIDNRGSITVLERTATIVTCPICLASWTLIDTPSGALPVQSLRPGMLVWTLDEAGKRVRQPIVSVVKTIVPAGHQIIHLVLDDGREVWVSPGHPTSDGLPVGKLQVGAALAGGTVTSVELVEYIDLATYDLLPGGETGLYWANGILLASTLE